MTWAGPIVEELGIAAEPVDVFRRLAHLPHCLFLDSAQRDSPLARYSFITADPVRWLQSHAEPWEAVRIAGEWLANPSTREVPGLPPFQGGVAGLLSYELGTAIEPLVPRARWDDLHTPLVALGLYDVVIAFDHQAEQSWLISQGFTESTPAGRRRRAAERITQFRQWLQVPRPESGPGYLPPRNELNGPCHPVASRYVGDSARRSGHPIYSNFSESAYLRMVQQGIDYIHAGDVFQVNLAQRVVTPAIDDPRELYVRLRTTNPAPFAGYFDLGAMQVISASPERFIQVSDRQVETRPIKGTRPRSRKHPEADLYAGSDLQQSDKDRAENVMIVDLLRNDLSRVCLPHSVQVPKLCQLESYAYVQHLVSVVTGTLRAEVGLEGLLRACFPGGSVTGAPKVRAMQIIAELEQVTRGPYCGSLGYWACSGASDWNLLIRTVTAAGGWWHLPVGGGIVADSQPPLEYAETWAKAEGILRALLPRPSRSTTG